MSAEDEKDVAGETPEEPRAEAKKPRTRKAPAKKAAKASKATEAKAEEGEKDGEAKAKDGEAKAKPARRRARKAPAKAAEEAAAEASPGAQEQPAAEKPAREQPAAEKPPARKARAKRPAAEKPAAEPTQAEPARRRGGEGKAPRRRVVRARARYVRTSARKARMVCGHLRGKTVAEARAILAFTPREVARDWSKLLESAVANAESNHELLQDDLIVREAYADEGPTIKRFRPRAMGRATPIRKRTSHLTITLTSLPEQGARARKR
jgi:ribosomal protein L22